MIELVAVWVLLTLSTVTAAVVFGEKYGYELIIGIFAGLIVAAQVLANKTVQVWEFTVPAAVIVYSAGYLLTDVLTEFHGKEQAKKAVWSGFLASIILVLSIQIAIAWPSASFWNGQSAFVETLGSTWRIVIASLSAYVISQNLDVYLFDKIKERTGSSKLYLRNLGSTGISQFIDTTIFITIAFYGVMPIMPMIVGQYIVKLAIAGLDTPFIYFVKLSRERNWINRLSM